MHIRNAAQVDFDSLSSITFLTWHFSMHKVGFDSWTSYKTEPELLKYSAWNSHRQSPLSMWRENIYNDRMHWFGGMLPSLPKDPFRREPLYATLNAGHLTVFAPGLLFCPYSGKFWDQGMRRYRRKEDEAAQRNYNSRHICAEIPLRGYKKATWTGALNLAQQWIPNPSYKIARHLSVSRKKQAGERCGKLGYGRHGRWGYMIEVYKRTPGRITEFLESIGITGLLKRNINLQKCVLRRIRKRGVRISNSELRFFQMFAGVDAINSALHHHETNRPKPTNQPVRQPRAARNNCVGASR